MTTTAIKKNTNLRNLVILTLWLRVLPLIIDPTKEARGNVVNSLIYFRFSASINRTYVIRINTNTQATNIFWIQAICRTRMFTCEACKSIVCHMYMVTVTYSMMELDFSPFSWIVWFLHNYFKSSDWILFNCDEKMCRFDLVYCVFFTPN